jgi:hypothetical protein
MTAPLAILPLIGKRNSGRKTGADSGFFWGPDRRAVNSASLLESVNLLIQFSSQRQLLRSKAPERVEGRGTLDG